MASYRFNDKNELESSGEIIADHPLADNQFLV